MFCFKSIACSVGILVSVSGSSFAQQDSVSTSLYEEPQQSSDFKRRERFKYLKRSMIEETSIFKISVQETWGGYYGALFNQFIGFEKKITPSFSFNPEIQGYIGTSRRSAGTGFNVALRYYYSQRRNVKKELSGNNLWSDFIEMKFTNIVSYSSSLRREYSWKSKPNLVLAWGLQRRVGRYVYFDFAAGLRSYQPQFWNGVSEKMRLRLYTRVAFGIALSGENTKRRK